MDLPGLRYLYLSLLILQAAVGLSARELIRNGGFETGTLANWKPVFAKAVDKPRLAVTNKSPHNGRYALSVSCRSFCSIFQAWRGQIDAIAYLSFTLTNTNNDSSTFEVLHMNDEYMGNSMRAAFKRLPAFKARKFFFPVYAWLHVPGIDGLTFTFKTGSGGFILDNISLTVGVSPVPTPQPVNPKAPNFIKNGGFENGAASWSGFNKNSLDPLGKCAAPHSGKRCLEARPYPPFHPIISQQPRLSKGTYVLSFFVRQSRNSKETVVTNLVITVDTNPLKGSTTSYGSQVVVTIFSFVPDKFYYNLQIPFVTLPAANNVRIKFDTATWTLPILPSTIRIDGVSVTRVL